MKGLLWLLAAFALAIRLFPYRTQGAWNLWPTIGLTGFAVGALGVTIYILLALALIKHRHLRRLGLLRGTAAADDDPVRPPSPRRR